jgi:1,4-alpha-glucan branching enzyme
VAGDAKRACIVGDFNDWNDTANPMKKTKTKGFTITLELEPEREYQFRYLVDGSKWENDRTADKYVKSPFGDSENSVVSI